MGIMTLSNGVDPIQAGHLVIVDPGAGATHEVNTLNISTRDGADVQIDAFNVVTIRKFGLVRVVSPGRVALPALTLEDGGSPGRITIF